MAIAANHLTNNDGTGSGTSLSTASITIATNALVLLGFTNYLSTGNPAAPTGVAGHGFTWTSIDSDLYYNVLGTNYIRANLRRALGTPSPNPDTIDFTWAASQTSVGWSVDEFTGTDTSGTMGSGAIVQSAQNGSNPNQTSGTITLAAFGSATNGSYGCFSLSDTATLPTPGTGYAELTTGDMWFPFTEFKVGDDDPDMSWTNANTWFGYGVEIKEAASATKARPIYNKNLLRVWKVRR